VFAKYAKYRERLGEALQEVCGEAAAAVELRLAQDGGVLGAALLAAAATAFDAQRPPDS
jgi:hexokinase